MFLNKEEIRKLIEEEQIISNYIDLETQLQPNGFDLTISQVLSFDKRGKIDFDNKTRKIASSSEVCLVDDAKLEWELSSGCYKVFYNEVINLPLNLMAMSIHRSSMLRCGATVETGVWDAGYYGRGRTLIVVHNPHGLTLTKTARISQMLFIPINQVKNGYSGEYQGESSIKGV